MASQEVGLLILLQEIWPTAWSASFSSPLRSLPSPPARLEAEESSPQPPSAARPCRRSPLVPHVLSTLSMPSVSHVASVG